MGISTSTRRDFLTGRLQETNRLPFPPGATGRTIKDCTGCGACLDACPEKIIVFQSGRPGVDFQQGECTFCGLCAERCPERVFPPDNPRQFFHHAVIGDDCLAMNFVDCQACRDVCPTATIRFRPRIGGPFLPELDADACTGCGACISVCPSSCISTHDREREVADA
jgi:ferredoxin-type protein NapF